MSKLHYYDVCLMTVGIFPTQSNGDTIQRLITEYYSGKNLTLYCKGVHSIAETYYVTLFLCIYGQTFASFIFVSFSDLFEIIVFYLCIYHAHSTSHNVFQIILKLSSRKLTGVGRGCHIVILAPKINR